MLRTIIAVFIILVFIGFANGQSLENQGDGLPLKVKPAEKTHFKLYEFELNYIDLQVRVYADDLFYLNNLELHARYRFNEAMFNKLTEIAKKSFDAGFASGIKESVKRHDKDILKYGVLGVVVGLIFGVVPTALIMSRS